MTDLTSLLIVLIAVAAFVFILRALARIVSWRITLPILAVAILAAAGLLDPGPLLAELDHLLANLFGGTT